MLLFPLVRRNERTFHLPCVQSQRSAYKERKALVILLLKGARFLTPLQLRTSHFLFEFGQVRGIGRGWVEYSHTVSRHRRRRFQCR